MGEKKQRSVDAHTFVGLHGRTVGVTGDRTEVGELIGGSSLDRCATLRPVRGADLAVFILLTSREERFCQSMTVGKA